MERTVIYQMTPEDLREFVDKELAQKNMNAAKEDLLKQCDHVQVDVKFVAIYLDITPQTVINYINDGLITPDPRTIEKGKYKFRLSYVLTLDYEKLKRQLKGRSYQ